VNYYMVSWDGSFTDFEARAWPAFTPYEAAMRAKRDDLGPSKDDWDAIGEMAKNGGKDSDEVYVMQDTGDVFLVTIESRLVGFDTETHEPVYAHSELGAERKETRSIRMVSIGPEQLKLASERWGDDDPEIGYFLDHEHTTDGPCSDCVELDALGL